MTARPGQRSWLPQEIIRTKRDGGVLSDADLQEFVAGLADGRVTEGQAAAFAMAVLWRGMTQAETVDLTRAMRDSGAVLDWRALGVAGPVLDKHSTGGVGDKTSLILAPLLAACGAIVPMLSGRGLGHTGGTLDKMDAILGYQSQPQRAEFVRVVREHGFAIVGATDEIAPADRRLYAVRDVTATVDSQPLIVASILSKKLAAGADALVMDVKVGSGAFLPDEAAARALASALVEVATGAGLPTVAWLTNMDQVLGRTAGNALEVAEALAMLTGAAATDARLREVTLTLAAEALVLGGLAADAEAGRRLAEARLADGSAAERFAQGVAALGGPRNLLEGSAWMSDAPCIVPVRPDRPGTVVALDVRAIGLAIIELGGGRTRPQDRIDHRVGFSEVAALGECVGPKRPLALVHAASAGQAERAATCLRAAMSIGDTATAPPLLHGRIGGAVT